MLKKISVLGGGNGAHTMAGDLSLRGYEVTMFEHPNLRKNIEKVRMTSEIELRGQIEGTSKIHKVTIDIKETIEGAELIILPIPSFAHRPFVELFAPYLEDGQIIVLTPGNFGSLEIARILKEKEVKKKLIIGETSTLPYGSRMRGPGVVEVLHKVSKGLLTATFPAKDSERVVKIFKEIYPATTLAKDVVEAALNNINFTIHPAGTILNAGKAEFTDMEKKSYFLYKEGISSSVTRVIEKVDEERREVARALDYSTASLREDIIKMGYGKGETLYEVLHFSEIFIKAEGPLGLKHRYVSEDVPYGLVPIASIGDIVGVDTPIIKSIITLASTLNAVDYWREGRNAERLGISGMELEELKKYLREGYRAR